MSANIPSFGVFFLSQIFSVSYSAAFLGSFAGSYNPQVLQLVSVIFLHSMQWEFVPLLLSGARLRKSCCTKTHSIDLRVSQRAIKWLATGLIKLCSIKQLNQNTNYISGRKMFNFLWHGKVEPLQNHTTKLLLFLLHKGIIPLSLYLILPDFVPSQELYKRCARILILMKTFVKFFCSISSL